MNNIDLSDAWRLLNLTLAVVLLCMVVWRRRMLFLNGPRWAMTAYGYVLVVLTVSTGSILKILNSAPSDVSIGITTTTLGAFIVSLTITEPNDPPRKALRDDLARLTRWAGRIVTRPFRR